MCTRRCTCIWARMNLYEHCKWFVQLVLERSTPPCAFINGHDIITCTRTMIVHGAIYGCTASNTQKKLTCNEKKGMGTARASVCICRLTIQFIIFKEAITAVLPSIYGDKRLKELVPTHGDTLCVRTLLAVWLRDVNLNFFLNGRYWGYLPIYSYLNGKSVPQSYLIV